MYQQLIACPGCRRHVRATEGACPFCGRSNGLTPVASPVVGRLSRAALVAALTLTGCPSEPSPIIAKDPANVKPTPTAAPDAGPTTPADSGLVDDPGSPVAEYGAPAPPHPTVAVPAYGAPAPPPMKK
jgi:hypothetical protein